jgi:SAM-dependent methyltransferase
MRLLVLTLAAFSVTAQTPQSPAAVESAKPSAAGPDQTKREEIRRFYDTRYREGKLAHLVLKDASPLLVESTRGRAPGAALDLGVGEGRNSLYLAAEKWRVTGVDLSRVGVDSAQKAAHARQLTLDLTVSDLDEYDIGVARWDLITSFYMQDWHYHSKTNTFARIAAGIRSGGLFVLEGFGPPRLRQDALEKAFAGWRILRSETIETEAEWGRGRGKRVVVRFVAEKP